MKPNAKIKSNPIRRYLIVFITTLLLLAGYFAYLVYRADQAVAPAPEPSIVKDEPENDVQPKEDSRPGALPDLEATVKNWVEKSPGEYSVVVYDLDAGVELAAYRPDTSYFTASIYKLYVAYLGYIDIKQGKHDLDDSFLNDWNRGKCLDEMIRTSHSPCAEKLWSEQGKGESTDRLKELGLKNTSLVNLTTTAMDTNMLLRRLYTDEDLEKAHKELLLDAMEEQIYRDAIAAGAGKLVVANKVGFRDLVEYHDVGIITLDSGRQIAVSIYSKKAGSKRIADLTRTIIARLDSAE